MKYNFIPSGNANTSNSIYIYILPAAFEGSSYLIAYPEFSAEDILSGRIIVRTFDGCSPDSLLEIRSEFKDRLQKKIEKYSERINTFFSVGIGALVLGIINCVIPDPIPFIDELLFIIGGGFTAWKFWNDRKNKLPALSEQIHHYVYEGREVEVETDPALTLIFKGIRCKLNPEAAGEVVIGLDRIEIECLWMSKYVNMEELTTSGKYNRIGDLVSVIEKVLPLKVLAKLEGKKHNIKAKERLQQIRFDTISKMGINNDALTVFIEIYRLFTQLPSTGLTNPNSGT